MTTIVTRAGKGSPLTNAEMDSNLTNLNTDKTEVSAFTAHTGAVSGAHAASAISNTPAGNVAATDVQEAINELDAEKAALSGATFTGQNHGVGLSFSTSGIIGVSANTAATAAQMNRIFRFDTASGSTLTTPATAGLTTGDTMIVQGGAVSGTLAMNGAELLLDEAGSTVDPLFIGAGCEVAVVFNGTNWYIAWRSVDGATVSSSVSQASAVALTSGVDANVTSIILQPGTWEVDHVHGFIPAATTSITRMAGGSNTTSATVDTVRGTQILSAAYVPGATAIRFSSMRKTYSVTTATTVYLVAGATFTVSTMGAYGSISARRVGL